MAHALALALDDPTRCRFIVSGDVCRQPGPYLVRVDDCPLITCDGRLICVGHRACTQHAAELRAGMYETDPSSRHVVRRADVDVWEITGAAR